MPVSFAAFNAMFDFDAFRKRLEEADARWNALTPEQRATEQRRIDARQEKVRKHIEWLDWCVKNKTDPNLVGK